MRDEAKERLELLSTIQDLGYESLRFSIFNDHRPGEWEVRIEFDSTSEHYFVYATMDRASYNKKLEFDNFEDARNKFIEKLDLTVKINRAARKNGEVLEYSSPLWDEKENHQTMRDESKERSELLLAIQDLGYSSLRYSIFSEEKPGEWEVVIEYNQVENLYFVYGTMDRGSFNGKHVYSTFQEAKTKFLDFLADIVIINRYYVKEGMPVNYPSPIWDDATE